jgi:acyl carrier protein
MDSEERVRSVVCRKLSADPSSISLETKLKTDFNLDVIGWIDLIMSLEEEFDLDIPDRKLDQFRTFGEIVRYLNSRLS